MSLTRTRSPAADPTVADELLLGDGRSASGKIWRRRRPDPRRSLHLVQALGLDPVLADLLTGRGIGPKEAEAFLRPTLRAAMPDPSCLKDMDIAAKRIADAIVGGEKIGIFGDYDVDGTVSAALWTRYLGALGIEVAVHLPDRLLEGYGPNVPAFEALRDEGSTLVLTVDCGATAGEALAGGAALGLDLIVIDHHLMDTVPDAALAVVNPNRPDCASSLGGLSAGGVSFMTLAAVNRALRARGFFEDRNEPNLLQWLDLVAVSLVCDVMPLTGLTRVLTAQGLSLLRDFDTSDTGNPGLRALAREAGSKGTAQAHHFGFGIGPRINAAGRIGHARLAYRLLVTDDIQEAADLALRLSELNGMRREVERAVLDEAVALAEPLAAASADTPLVVAGEGWHPGVIGIVAGRLKERFGRPAICIALEGDTGKGSGRSVPGVDLGEAIGHAAREGIIAGGGGHAMAAGLSVTRDQIPGFTAYLAERLGGAVREARASAALWIDGVLTPGGVTRSLSDGVAGAGPFGNGNPEPRFALRDVKIVNLRVLKEAHMAVDVADGMEQRVRGIAFSVIGTPLGDFLQGAADGQNIHLAGRIKPDDWRGGAAAQIQIEDGAFA